MKHEKADKKQEELNEQNEIENQAAEEQASDNQPEETVSDKRDEQIAELKEQIQRLGAEFDNYKKRTVKEKEKIYITSVSDVVGSFLPVLDNVERAMKASEGAADSQCIRDGVVLIHRQIGDILSNLGVKAIDAIGKTFDPSLHEAVMHVEDEAYGQNEVIEEFQKGYIYKDEAVIRHSVVKVAN